MRILKCTLDEIYFEQDNKPLVGSQTVHQLLTDNQRLKQLIIDFLEETGESTVKEIYTGLAGIVPEDTLKEKLYRLKRECEIIEDRGKFSICPY